MAVTAGLCEQVTLDFYFACLHTEPMHDFRFEITELPEAEMGETHLVRMIELVLCPPDAQWSVETVIDGEQIEAFYTDDPFGAVEAAREAQAFTLEERFEMYAQRGW